MSKEEFDKNFKLIESYMTKAPKEIEKAYKFLRTDYVEQLKTIEEVKEKAIEIQTKYGYMLDDIIFRLGKKDRT